MGTRRRRYSDSFADDSLQDEDTLNGKEPCDADPANTFKILVASDIHLGYCDNDTERGMCILQRHKHLKHCGLRLMEMKVMV